MKVYSNKVFIQIKLFQATEFKHVVSELVFCVILNAVTRQIIENFQKFVL